MSTDKRSWIRWLLPFIVSGGMAFGAMVGYSNVSDTVLQQGVSGHAVGTIGAVILVSCLAAGFVMSALTVIVSRVLRRGIPGYICIRAVLSLVGGGAVVSAAFAGGVRVVGVAGANSKGLMDVIVWLLLLGIPVVVSLSRRPKSISGLDAPAVKQP